MDWSLIAAWREAGVPLQVAIRGIDIAMDAFLARQRNSSKVNSLCYCHDSVMTEYANHLESHVGESSEPLKARDGKETGSQKDEAPGTGETLEYIRERMDEIKALSAKQCLESTLEGIGRVLARLDELCGNLEKGGRIDSETLERDLSIINELLVSELWKSISPEQILEWEKEAKKELKVYRKRLPKETYERIRGNFIRDKTRRRFNIGELSVFRL